MQATAAKPIVKVPGTWYPTGHDHPAFVAICGQCGREVPAVQLVEKRLPWGKGLIWACRGGC